MCQVFDSIADSYDRWYDTGEGKAIFNAEVKCLLSLQEEGFARWVEVGVGTGRFAHALGVPLGIDPSGIMLAFAARRGIKGSVGSAEHLPLPDGAFAGVLMALTLCFVAEANRALNECHRVVRPGGRLLLGVVPADSAWGRAYIEKSAEGHAVYRHARFRTTAETVELARDAGFELLHAASTLFWMPGEDAEIEPHVEPRIAREAGFAGLLFEKVGRDRSQDARNKGKAIHDDKVDYAVYKPFQQSSPTGSLQTPRTVRAWI